jgi:hypothetical protein
MADFSSSGIWDLNRDGIMVEYDRLGLPKGLINEFEAWIQFYDDSFEGKWDHMKKGSEYFNRKGKQLARRVKAFHPDAVIMYWGEDEKGLLEPVEIK